MGSFVAKILPFVVGAAIGILLFNPPEAFAELGALRHVIMAALGAVLLVAFLVAMIGANLPADIGVKPLGGPPDASLQALATRLRALGFVDAGPPYEVAVSPPAAMMAFVHPTEPVYAAAYRTGTVPAVLNFDFVSILDGFRGGLTTNPDVRGATLPAAPGSFRQIFPGGSVEQLLAEHQRGMAFIRARGFGWRAVSAASFVDDFKRSIRLQREAFLAARLRTTLVALWRTVSKRVPDVGTLSAQAGISERLQELATGRRG